LYPTKKNTFHQLEKISPGTLTEDFRFTIFFVAGLRCEFGFVSVHPTACRPALLLRGWHEGGGRVGREVRNSEESHWTGNAT
jgi:hypothetical protein